MKASNLVHLSGLAALLGAMLLIIDILSRLVVLPAGRSGVDYLTSEVVTTWSWVVLTGIALPGLALLMAGLVGLYVVQSEAAGVLGFVGFLMLFFGLAVNLAMRWFQVFVLPDAAVAAPDWVDANNTGWIRFGFALPGVLSLLGGFLFAVATLRARIYPLAPAVTLVIGVMLTTLVLPYPLEGVDAIVRNMAIGWLGFALFMGRIGSREEPLPSLNLVRWGALGATFAGVAWMAWVAARFLGAPSFYEDAVGAVMSLALIGTMGGLVALRALQERRYGRLGQAGFYFAFVGALFVLVIRLYLSDDVRDAMIGLGVFAMAIGFFLLGVATFRARVVPRWCGLLLILGVPLWVTVTVASASVADGYAWIGIGLTLGVIWLAIGYALWRRHDAPVEQTSGRSEVPEEKLSPS